MSFPFFKNNSASFFEPIVVVSEVVCVLCPLYFIVSFVSAFAFAVCDKCFLFKFYNKLLLKLPKLFAKIQNTIVQKAKLNIYCQLNL